MTQVTGNLILNSYGGSHNIDHDDGSEYYNASANVVAFAQACKGNFGSHRLCNNNLILFPGAKIYSHSKAGGGNCASQSDNGHFSTYADKHFESNTCAHLEGRHMLSRHVTQAHAISMSRVGVHKAT